MSATVFYNISADKLLALTAWAEARSEGGEGMMAVINVIRNRAKESAKFADQSILSATGSIWHAVILKPCQFSCFNDGSSSACPNRDPQRAVLEQMANNFDSAVLTNSTLAQAYQLSKMLFMNTLADNTAGATFYHAVYVTPSWASVIPFIGQIGNHLFYGTKKITEILGDYTPYIALAIIGITTFIIIRKRRLQ